MEFSSRAGAGMGIKLSEVCKRGAQELHGMKRISIILIILLFSLPSLPHAAGLQTGTIERSSAAPKVKQGAIEIRPVEEPGIRGGVIMIEPQIRKYDKIKRIDMRNLRPQNPDELFRCDDAGSLSANSGPVCAHQVHIVMCEIPPCHFYERWMNFPAPRDACAAQNISEYALGRCIHVETDPDIEFFKEQAMNSQCADLENRLYLIDDSLVFRRIEGDCPDAGYGLTLYDRKSRQILCSLHDNIAGPRRTINDKNYEQLFDVIMQNLDKPDLGLGDLHRVEEIQLAE